MAWFEFFWTDDTNVAHLAEHGITPEDFEHVFDNFVEEQTSRSSGRPVRFGYTQDGRYIAVVFEWIEEDVSVYPITAYEV